MNNIKNLEHSFLRTEADNQYALFLKINSSLLEQDINIDLTDDRRLSIKTENGDTFLTNTLSDDIYNHLANHFTSTFFTNENGDILAQYKLEPLNPISVKRVKP